MIIHESIPDFFRFGSLHCIPYGITRAQLVALLGETNWQHFSRDTDKNPSILKYGQLEFYFMSDDSSEGMSGIYFQPLTRSGSNGNLLLDTAGWVKDLSIDKAEILLREAMISYVKHASRNNNDVIILQTEGNVHIFFDTHLDYPSLHKAAREMELK
jgi:hypothetical protein